MTLDEASKQGQAHLKFVCFYSTSLPHGNKISLRGHRANSVYVNICVSPFQILKELIRFQESWHERYATGGHLGITYNQQ
jgi:hypothetical protein